MAGSGEAGHRNRLRQRFLAGESGVLADATLLEMLLTFVIDRKDVRPLAQELIKVFGNLTGVLSAPPNELLQVKGVGQSSVALLQLVNHIRSGTLSTDTDPIHNEATAAQSVLFADDHDTMRKQRPHRSNNEPDESSKGSLVPDRGNTDNQVSVVDAVLTSIPHESSIGTQELRKVRSKERSNRRKLQVSNGYLLDFDQLARVLNLLYEHREAKKISRKVLQDDSGLSERQVENLVSMGSAMGLIRPGNQVLTPTGLIIARHDIFIERQGTLEWCHYVGAGSYRNLVWFEIFNSLLRESSPMNQTEWLERLRSELSGEFTPKTLGTGLREEVRFVTDAYLERNFKRLGLLRQGPGERIYRRRYTDFIPIVLAAMVYDFCAVREEHLAQVAEMATAPGSPAMVFGLDVASFRQQIEGLHAHEWIRYETSHNLDQIRLKPGFSALEFLTAHFEDREPRQVTNQAIK